MDELLRRITQLERWRDTFIKSEVGRWLDWTPTVTQSGSVTATINFARYAVIQNTVFLRARLTITGAGTTANAVTIGGLPYAIANQLGNVGIIEVLDSGVSFYVGSLDVVASTNTLVGRAHGLTGAIGVTPNFALAANDLIAISGAYERA